MATKTYCKACGGEGWLPSRPEGDSECPYCRGTGREGTLPRTGARASLTLNPDGSVTDGRGRDHPDLASRIAHLQRMAPQP